MKCSVCGDEKGPFYPRYKTHPSTTVRLQHIKGWGFAPPFPDYTCGLRDEAHLNAMREIENKNN